MNKIIRKTAVILCAVLLFLGCNENAAVTPPPQNLTAVAGYYSVKLTWDAVAGVEAYHIYKDGNYDTWTNSTSKVLTGLTAGTRYIFTVKQWGNGGHSAAVTAIPKALPAPQNLTAAPIIINRVVTLTWNAAAGAERYYIYQDGKMLSRYTSSTSKTINDLIAGREYRFTVKAWVNGGYSAPSEAVTSTPK